MVRKLTLATLLGLFSMAAVIAADGDKPDAKEGKGKFDKSKLFEKMDANGDGKITKEEYKKSQEAMLEKIKDKLGDKADMMTKIFEKMFDKMDADSDGVVTKEEFEKFQPTIGGAGKGKFDLEKLKKLKEKKDE